TAGAGAGGPQGCGAEEISTANPAALLNAATASAQVPLATFSETLGLSAVAVGSTTVRASTAHTRHGILGDMFILPISQRCQHTPHVPFPKVRFLGSPPQPQGHSRVSGEPAPRPPTTDHRLDGLPYRGRSSVVGGLAHR